jgi:hypothetical protein
MRLYEINMQPGKNINNKLGFENARMECNKNKMAQQ